MEAIDIMAAGPTFGYASGHIWSGLETGRRSARETARIRVGEEFMQTAGNDARDMKGHSASKQPEIMKGNAFQAEATTAIQEVRTSLLTMLESGGKQILKTRDVQKLFNLDVRLSWELFRLFNASDMLGAVQYVPPAVSMQKIFTAARAKGMVAESIEAAENAFRKFEQFVVTHAGDRTRFESMVSAMGQGEEAQQAMVQQRKSLFKAHTYLWGVELGTFYSADILGPSRDNADFYDAVTISNLLEFHRLRPGADTLVSQIDARRMAAQGATVSPLDEEAMKAYNSPVLPQFSMSALPTLRTTIDEQGNHSTVLAGDSVGLTSVVDLAFAWKIRGTEGYSNAFSAVGWLITHRPTRQLYKEFLMHRSMFPRLHSTSRVFGHVIGSMPPSEFERPAYELPNFDQIVYERSPDETRLAGVPRRRELLSHCCEKMGWNLRDFDVYRLHAEYPVIDTVNVMRLRAAD